MILVAAEPVAFLRDHIDLLVTPIWYYPDVKRRYVSFYAIYHILHHLFYTRNWVERLLC